jgi:hypothetical protein
MMVLLVKTGINFVCIVAGWFRVKPSALFKIYYWDGQTVLFTQGNVLSLTRPYNTGYQVKYHVFFSNFSTVSTNPIRQLYSSGYSAYSCLIGLVDLIGRHSAMNLAKPLIVSEKTISIIAHLCSRTAIFCQNSVLFTRTSLIDRSDTQEQRMLFDFS